MYVCMSEAPEHVCMYVCMYAPKPCVLLSFLHLGLNASHPYVCMSHSKLQNQLISEGVKFLIKTIQNLTFNSFFFEL